MKKIQWLLAFMLIVPSISLAQHFLTPDELNRLRPYQDSLTQLSHTLINNENELERKNANYAFIRTLVKALQTPNSFSFGFDSVKSISIQTSPDDKFRIFSWFLMNDDGSYRFYGAIQMNIPGKLALYPLEDYSPLLKNPQDSMLDNRKWYGAEYYKIIPVASSSPYYILLGWKGNTIKSTKKVIEVLRFQNNKPLFGMPVFEEHLKPHKRIIFEYSRQASMLLHYVPEQKLIVFDHLAPPDDKLKDKPDLYGPDLTYDGYKLINGKWQLKDNLDMRNVPTPQDIDQPDPKKQAIIDRNSVPVRKQ
ncbi:hypothetical protein HH214_00030 [Mucilaginibacter robiniae]|uniref:Uncharacterized protein n=1 Tax=Mucilaginibacter robiniae TaxID=2728022 RepID=A0A7L5DTF6_9SPHI|nr:hypothetical protein [Mucilaginibacter robiniae]QJD94370.1 hypothetical protein HH214_00030 [Mucilaginibacter robiniae]